MSRAQQVSADPKQILHTTMHRQEALRVSDRLEPAHLALALPRRLMRDLRSVVLVLLRAVYDRRHHGAVRGGVAAQLIRNQPARRTALSFQQFPEETGGRSSAVASTSWPALSVRDPVWQGHASRVTRSTTTS